jgi:hypothetical protein
MTFEADCESHFAIRKKMSARERRTASIQGFPENFFIAKKRDSESARRIFYPAVRLGTMRSRCRSFVSGMQNIAAAQPLLATLTNVDVEFSRVIRIASSTRLRFVAKHAVVVPKTLRQHFLKRDTVFFNVLVYSD